MEECCLVDIDNDGVLDYDQMWRDDYLKVRHYHSVVGAFAPKGVVHHPTAMHLHC